MNCCAKIPVKSRRPKCWILCTTWIALELLWEASQGRGKSSLTLGFFTVLQRVQFITALSGVWAFDSTAIKWFLVNSRAAKARHMVTLQVSERMSSAGVCHSFSPTAVTAAPTPQTPLYTFSHAWVFESPPPAEMICYDKSQPNQAFCQQQLENIHVFIACTFYISHCYCSVINVFIAHNSFLPRIKRVLQLEKTPGWTGKHIPNLTASLPL